MAAPVSGAERQLLALYTRQAYEAYLAERLGECERLCGQMGALNPGDIHAIFLSGAITGRKARPGEEMSRILDAVRIWKPLFSLEGAALEAMKAAMDEAFTTMLYIPVELASRQWDVYSDVRTARQLARTIRTLLSFDESFAAQPSPYGQWIHSLFTKNYVFLVDEILGINKAFPVGAESESVLSYGEVLSEALRMAEAIPGTGESEAAVRARARERLQSFREHNHLEG